MIKIKLKQIEEILMSSVTGLVSALSGKNDTLSAGVNIKNVGGQSLVGSGSVTEVQNSLTSSSVLAPSVDVVNTALSGKVSNPAGTGVLFVSSGTVTVASGNTSQYMKPTGSIGTLSTDVRGLTISTDPGTSSALTTSTTFQNAVWQLQNQFLGSVIVNTTTSALSSANLNSSYGSVPVGTRVICKDILGAGLIYTKVTEAGSSDVWVSTPITIVV